MDNILADIQRKDRVARRFMWATFVVSILVAIFALAVYYRTLQSASVALEQFKVINEGRDQAVLDLLADNKRQTFIICTFSLRRDSELILTDAERAQIEDICNTEIERFINQPEPPDQQQPAADQSGSDTTSPPAPVNTPPPDDEPEPPPPVEADCAFDLFGIKLLCP